MLDPRRPTSNILLSQGVSGESFSLRIRVVRQLFQYPDFARMSQARRSSTPCWLSDARLPTSRFPEDVSSESSNFENQCRNMTPPISLRCGDVSSETHFHAMLDIWRPISNIFIVLRMAQARASCLRGCLKNAMLRGCLKRNAPPRHVGYPTLDLQHLNF